MMGRTLGHYKIASQLGKGGMGEVFKAKDQKFRRDVVGSGTGERLKGVRFEFEAEGAGKKVGRCCAALSGFSLHAAVCISGKARRQLENLCMYVRRPAAGTERMSRFPDGRVLYRLRHRWRDGTSYVINVPQQARLRVFLFILLLMALEEEKILLALVTKNTCYS